MLKKLIINNFAIINKLQIDFKSGMTALTGETGAGKSIIIDALGLLVGSRSSIDFIRTGQEQLNVQGLFEVKASSPIFAILAEYGIAHDDNQIIIKREINRKGRNVCRINNELVKTNVLRQVGKFLVEIHGQNQQQELLDEDNHINILDRFADDDFQHDLLKYVQLFEEYQAKRSRLRTIQKNSQNLVQRIDMLKFQIEDIDSAQLQAGEDDKLEDEKNQLSNFEKISSSLQDSYRGLSENNVGVVDALGNVRDNLEEIMDYDSSYKELYDSVNGAYYQLQDNAATIADQLENLDFDENRLDEIQKRLITLDNLKKKYGPTLDEVIEFSKNAHEELSKINIDDDTEAQLTDEISQYQTKLLNLGKDLSKQRHKTATALEKSINRQLKDLYMPNAKFGVAFKSLDDDNLSPKGIDQIQFNLKTNVGEDYKPLVRVASGGELSRVILAFEAIIAEKMNVETIVFDEIDTGVSGRVAQAIGDKIYKVSQFLQVLCITHLPQVAAMSDIQFEIKKETVKDKTETKVSILNDLQRIEAISLMLAGTKVTDLTRKHAQELLELAQGEQQRLD
ncbi:DNA repair protein RecN [Companilactobacillus kimchii]|uniref:DNA repair protein RecN n=3 Tax=Companilactobacillus TaxID=2767879 RepID=A0ABR5NQE0_9LACO|nr:DNA repair protein RecN [Companilactobacillus kimchii]KAE9562844.1 DNA repair protein RecN [Companilactobacillus kimchii]KRK49877.1 DNA repair ATPase [Companilactobacillus kimchii DSM 13961 = JCM 10707]OWF33156.1 DNA repair protein RecN [Companilactobacillus kimchii]GEO46759.1 DNA repair protein RecN [Companilactobacillus paralimentarius]